MKNIKRDLAFLMVWIPSLLSAQTYDLIIKGGRVIDPRNAINRILDVAIVEGKIQKVAEEIYAGNTDRVIDASGMLVVPGLIDVHTHVFVGEAKTFAGGFPSVSPDDFSFRSGVTTMVDAGTSGWRSFERFKTTVIDRSDTRVLAFLNITGAGMVGKPLEEDLQDMSIDSTMQTLTNYPDILVGVKIGHYQGQGWEPFERAMAVSQAVDKPLFLECHLPNLPLPEILERMNPGDIFTHIYGAVDDRDWLINSQGQVIEHVLKARDKGVYFDVGHGGGSFHYQLAVPAVSQQFYPDSFGTDLHRYSMNAGMKDITNIMSKFLNLGMPLEEVIAAATWKSAVMIGREDLGHLSPGAIADIALLKLETGEFGFVDAAGYRISGDRRLTPELTLREGRVKWDLNGISAPLWNH